MYEKTGRAIKATAGWFTILNTVLLLYKHYSAQRGSNHHRNPKSDGRVVAGIGYIGVRGYVVYIVDDGELGEIKP